MFKTDTRMKGPDFLKLSSGDSGFSRSGNALALKFVEEIPQYSPGLPVLLLSRHWHRFDPIWVNHG
jgi:hypothetical protein